MLSIQGGENYSRIRHGKDCETPLPVYIAMKLHAHTRMRHMIDKFHELGLTISYDRYLQISNSIGNKLCKLYDQENCILSTQTI